MWPFRHKEREALPRERLDELETALRRLRAHVEDLEDVLGRRVDKLMHRARRAQQEEQEPDPAGTDAGPVIDAPRADKRRMAEIILRRGNGLLR